jgi:hypothetical protein
LPDRPGHDRPRVIDFAMTAGGDARRPDASGPAR